jgi:hypothetical protein
MRMAFMFENLEVYKKAIASSQKALLAMTKQKHISKCAYRRKQTRNLDTCEDNYINMSSGKYVSDKKF